MNAGEIHKRTDETDKQDLIEFLSICTDGLTITNESVKGTNNFDTSKRLLHLPPETVKLLIKLVEQEY